MGACKPHRTHTHRQSEGRPHFLRPGLCRLRMARHQNSVAGGEANWRGGGTGGGGGGVPAGPLLLLRSPLPRRLCKLQSSCAEGAEGNFASNSGKGRGGVAWWQAQRPRCLARQWGRVHKTLGAETPASRTALSKWGVGGGGGHQRWSWFAGWRFQVNALRCVCGGATDGRCFGGAARGHGEGGLGCPAGARGMSDALRPVATAAGATGMRFGQGHRRRKPPPETQSPRQRTPPVGDDPRPPIETEGPSGVAGGIGADCRVGTATRGPGGGGGGSGGGSWRDAPDPSRVACGIQPTAEAGPTPLPSDGHSRHRGRPHGQPQTVPKHRMVVQHHDVIPWESASE